MTEPDDPCPMGRAQALARVRELKAFYDSLKAAFQTQLQQIGTAVEPPSKTHVARLADLQAIHVHLLKAEDSFIEKFGQGTDDADIDHDALRADIGRSLDRIRDRGAAGDVSGGADGQGGEGPAVFVRFLGAAASAAARG
ncbi:hypothetical protein [Loktanella atrilutea]|uniref:hypothetical protein n=1 Tax=Loktanella atrilutea TaxID=366533 RepID=UPI001FE6CFEC|nr:hypothetical protein [Loktanella atrilutea]